MKTLKIISIVIIVIAIPGAALVYGIAEYIYRTKSCEYMNIDNMELRAQLDIPNITDMQCNYDKPHDTKRVFFRLLDTSPATLNQYISRYGFQKLKSQTELTPSDFLILKADSVNFNHAPQLYFRKLSYKGNESKAVLNKQSGQLWINLKYAE